jgi:hypothetical protein
LLTFGALAANQPWQLVMKIGEQHPISGLVMLTYFTALNLLTGFP